MLPKDNCLFNILEMLSYLKISLAKFKFRYRDFSDLKSLLTNLTKYRFTKDAWVTNIIEIVIWSPSKILAIFSQIILNCDCDIWTLWDPFKPRGSHKDLNISQSQHEIFDGYIMVSFNDKGISVWLLHWTIHFSTLFAIIYSSHSSHMVNDACTEYKWDKYLCIGQQKNVWENIHNFPGWG